MLYKGTLTPNPQCRRRRQIVEVANDTPLAVHQRSANCRDEVEWFITNSCLRPVVYHPVMTSPLGFHSRIPELCRLSKKSSWAHCSPHFHHCCYAPYELHCTVRKPSFTEIDHSFQFKLRNFLKCRSSSEVGAHQTQDGISATWIANPYLHLLRVSVQSLYSLVMFQVLQTWIYQVW